jgi:hypothetical protein
MEAIEVPRVALRRVANDPGDDGGLTSTWAWDQSDDLVPIANNALVAWLGT